jgi:hypothetical protein
MNAVTPESGRAGQVPADMNIQPDPNKPPTSYPVVPIWLRDKQAVAIYSISRTKLWQLQKAGKIRSVSLTEPGMARATRLFDAKSIEAYIESFLPENQQNKEESK